MQIMVFSVAFSSSFLKVLPTFILWSAQCQSLEFAEIPLQDFKSFQIRFTKKQISCHTTYDVNDIILVLQPVKKIPKYLNLYWTNWFWAWLTLLLFVLLLSLLRCWYFLSLGHGWNYHNKWMKQGFGFTESSSVNEVMFFLLLIISTYVAVTAFWIYMGWLDGCNNLETPCNAAPPWVRLSLGAAWVNMS